MGKPLRSPLRGYNHNLGHLGRVFHVQTEDSGPAAPRLFTHLFFEGSILASRKHEYDAALPDDQVRALMQSQHKTVMRDLMQARFDERITAFFAARGEAVAPSVEGAVPAATVPESPGPVMLPHGAPPVAAEPMAAVEPAPAAEPVAAPAPTPVPPAATAREGSGSVAAREGSGSVAVRVGPRRTSTRPLETSRREGGNNPGPVVVRPADARRPPFVRNGAGPVAKISSADGVVVQRSVVVGDATAPSRPARIRPPVPYVVTGGGHTEKPPRADAAVASEPAPPQPAAPQAVAAPTASASPSEPRRTTTTGFGVSLSDDKSLDEVILEYLSEDGD
jgi:hypothetical protein